MVRLLYYKYSDLISEGAPNAQHKENILLFARDLLDPLRAVVGFPIDIYQGYVNTTSADESVRVEQTLGYGMKLVCHNNLYIKRIVNGHFPEFKAELIEETKASGKVVEVLYVYRKRK